LLNPLLRKLKEYMERIKQTKKIKDFYSIMIIYLYSLSTVTSSPRDVINLAGKSRYALGDLTSIFSKASTLMKKWNYTLYKATQTVSTTIKEDSIKKFLQRLSYSLSMEVDLENFMKIEYEKLLETSSAEFDRAIERAKRYIEAYSALLTSATFLSVSMLLTSMIYGVNIEQVLTYSILMIAGTLVTIIFLMARTLPPDPILHNEELRPETLKLLEKINSLLLTPCIVTLILLFISFSGKTNPENSILSNLMPIPLSFITAGLPLLIVGRMGRKWVKQVEKIDENYPSFVKSLGDANLLQIL